MIGPVVLEIRMNMGNIYSDDDNNDYDIQRTNLDIKKKAHLSLRLR